jgi:hypothetical protein
MAATRILRYRAVIYVLLNAAIAVAVLCGAVVQGAALGLAVYVCALLALCSAPLLWLEQLNNRYALLGMFMALYFLFFGALDLKHLLLGADEWPVRSEFMTVAEFAILTGGALVLLSYLTAARIFGSAGRERSATDWPASALLLFGTVLWVVGTAAMVYLQVFVMPEKTSYAVRRGLAEMGPLVTFLVMLGHLVEPLGILILAYGYARFRTLFWRTLIIVVVAAQVVLGFLMDVKSTAMLGGVLVILVRTLSDRRVPVAWLASAIAFGALSFPIFQAYRAEVEGERGLDRLHVIQHLGKALSIAVASREKVMAGRPGERAQTFLERTSGKAMLEVLFDHVGSDVPLLHGSTLAAIPMAFVPRLLAPDKSDVATGRLFNRMVLKNDDDTYISISHLGELYWNFGWSGIIVGMLFSGLLLGCVGARFSLEQGVTVTRMLVLLATVDAMCMGFGGEISTSYVLWLRSLAVIALMHVMFAARPARFGDAPEPAHAPGAARNFALARTPFPNLMR